MLFQWRVIPPVPPLLTEHITGDLQGTPFPLDPFGVHDHIRGQNVPMHKRASRAPADLRV